MLHKMLRPWPAPSATSTSCLLPLLLLISVLASLLPPSSSGVDEDTSIRYNECRKRSFSCGKRTIEVSYPFYDNESASYCGHPGFELSCDSQGSAISLGVEDKLYYLVDHAINYDNHSITLVDQSLVGESCPRPIPNISLNPLFFNYSDLAVNVTFWECSNPISQLLSFNFSCSNGDTNSLYKYYWPNSSIPGDVLGQVETCPITWEAWMVKSVVQLMIAGSISYEQALLMGFTVTWTPEVWQSCSDCIDSGGFCGSLNWSQVCFCRNFSAGRHGSCSPHREGEPGSEQYPIALSPSPVVHPAVAAAAAAAAAATVPILSIYAALVFFICQKNKNKSGRITPNIKAFLNDHSSLAPKAYKYSDLKKITKSFHDKLGQGGYGSVYRGQLQDGRAVAVKILDNSKESGADFINEVASIGRTSHVNIVSLLGFCLDGRRRALVYEFMPNGSLDKYIYSEEPKALLPWDKLYQIAIGIAHGLEYLHRGCSTRIVHFDIKPHNILLDEDFHPKISDFGLAKLCPHRESKLSVADARGTIGFIAPEVFSRYFGEVSTKSDVYSYGMMVLEMVGGRRNVKACDRTSEVYFPHWVYEHLDRDEDLRPYHVAPETEGIARRMIIVGLWCIQPMPANRPSISKVVEMLEGTAGDLEMPAKPFICSPVRSPPIPRVQSMVDSSSD